MLPLSQGSPERNQLKAGPTALALLLLPSDQVSSFQLSTEALGFCLGWPTACLQLLFPQFPQTQLLINQNWCLSHRPHLPHTIPSPEQGQPW